jgi:hypothetical protein
MTSLAEHLAEPPDDDDQPRDHWQVHDPSSAEWAMRKLARIRRIQRENTAVAVDEHRRIEEWLNQHNGTLEREAEYFEALLTTWHRTVLEDDPDRKTINLPVGDLKARRQPEQWTFGPDFTEWARVHRPDVVRTKYEPDVRAAKLLLARVGGAVVDKDSGEFVPGVQVEDGGTKFVVEVRP